MFILLSLTLIQYHRADFILAFSSCLSLTLLLTSESLVLTAHPPLLVFFFFNF